MKTIDRLRKACEAYRVTVGVDEYAVSLDAPTGYVLEASGCHYVDAHYGGFAEPHATVAAAAKWLLDGKEYVTEVCLTDACVICAEGSFEEISAEDLTS